MRRGIWHTCCRAQVTPPGNVPRWIHLKTLKKREEAAKQWDERADAILRGEATNLWDVFEERGFVKDIAGFVVASFTACHSPADLAFSHQDAPSRSKNS